MPNRMIVRSSSVASPRGGARGHLTPSAPTPRRAPGRGRPSRASDDSPSDRGARPGSPGHNAARSDTIQGAPAMKVLFGIGFGSSPVLLTAADVPKFTDLVKMAE